MSAPTRSTTANSSSDFRLPRNVLPPGVLWVARKSASSDVNRDSLLLAGSTVCRILRSVNWRLPLLCCGYLACQKSSEGARGSRILLLRPWTQMQARPSSHARRALVLAPGLCLPALNTQPGCLPCSEVQRQSTGEAAAGKAEAAAAAAAARP